MFLHMTKEPIRAGEIVVFNVDVSHSFLVLVSVCLLIGLVLLITFLLFQGRDIPIVHRAIKVMFFLTLFFLVVVVSGDLFSIVKVLLLHYRFMRGKTLDMLMFSQKVLALFLNVNPFLKLTLCSSWIT